MEIFRSCLQECGFSPRGSRNQEDASELFLFLVDKLGAPNIPIKEVLFHGGKEHADDKKDTSESMLPLSTVPRLFPFSKRFSLFSFSPQTSPLATPR